VGCILFQYLNESEANAIEVVGKIASVRFASANMTFEEKKSSFFIGLDTLKDTLNYEEKLRTFSYFVYIFMLVSFAMICGYLQNARVFTATAYLNPTLVCRHGSSMQLLCIPVLVCSQGHCRMA